MIKYPEGNAIVYCEGAFETPNGKTAHGLVRRTDRYDVLSVVDSTKAGLDAGLLLDGKAAGIPVHASIKESLDHFSLWGQKPTHLVIGLAPDGGRISKNAKEDIKEAIKLGLNIDSGLHDFLSEDAEISKLAREKGVEIRDVRKTPPREELHFFSGKIEKVKSLVIAILGTDSAIGKRTTAWILKDALEDMSYKAELIGTGQTAWMQGVRYGIILDSLINDFVSGEIEDAVWQAWQEVSPDIIIIEGQGSLMNPAYPGGFEILAAGRPDIVVLQHAPARKEYDGFPGYAIHPLEKQIQAIQLLSEKHVVAVTVNHEGLEKETIPSICEEITQSTGLPAFDVLLEGANGLAKLITSHLKKFSKAG
ncbi:DUF1611 domain-containing protein [Thermodesulfobacteriota bacterium]